MHSEVENIKGHFVRDTIPLYHTEDVADANKCEACRILTEAVVDSLKFFLKCILEIVSGGSSNVYTVSEPSLVVSSSMQEASPNQFFSGFNPDGFIEGKFLSDSRHGLHAGIMSGEKSFGALFALEDNTLFHYYNEVGGNVELVALEKGDLLVWASTLPFGECCYFNHINIALRLYFLSQFDHQQFMNSALLRLFEFRDNYRSI